MDINGHDILSALCYKNPLAQKLFNDKNFHKLNRNFETALIEEYDYDCFKKTFLFLKLREAQFLQN